MIKIHLKLLLFTSILVSSLLHGETMERADEAYSSGDIDLAIKIWKKYASSNNSKAQNNLGMMLRDGKGIEQNFDEAAKLFILSADSDNQYAQSNLGLMYLDGLGVTQSNSQAAKYFKLSSDQGNASAQTTLGYMHHLGVGMPINFLRAIELYKSAANQGYSIAQRNLGYIYKTGNSEGNYKDKIYSTMWFILAETDNDPVAKNELKKLRAEISEDDYRESIQMVEKCFKKDFIDC